MKNSIIYVFSLYLLIIFVSSKVLYLLNSLQIVLNLGDMGLGYGGNHGGGGYFPHSGLQHDHDNDHLRVPSCSEKEQCGGGFCCKFIGGCFCSHYSCKKKCGGGKKKAKASMAAQKSMTSTIRPSKLFQISKKTSNSLRSISTDKPEISKKMIKSNI